MIPLAEHKMQGGFECTLLFDGALVLLKCPQFFDTLFSQEVAWNLELFARGRGASIAWVQGASAGCTADFWFNRY